MMNRWLSMFVVFPLMIIFAVAFAAPVKLSGTLVSGGNVSDFAVSDPAGRVVFIADRETNNVNELYSTAIGGGTITKLSGSMVTGGNVTSFRLSPNGQAVLFVADRVTNAAFELWYVPIDGSAAPVSLSGAIAATALIARTDYAWSPDSARVVMRLFKSSATVAELFSIGTTIGSTLINITGPLVSGGSVQGDFAISDDSARVVFRANKSVAAAIELYSGTITGTTPSRISGPTFATGRNVVSFKLSENSAQVVFLANKDTATAFELYRVAISGTTPVKISGAIVSGGNVSDGYVISPDSAQVVFRADAAVDEQFELYSVAIPGSVTPIKISGTLIGVGGDVTTGFLVSPDSSRVVFSAAPINDGITNLYSVAIAGVTPVKISGAMIPGGVSPNALASRASISPDSTRVVFNVDRGDAQPELGSVGIADTVPTSISGPQVVGGGPTGFSISPNSAQVVFVSVRDDLGRAELYSVAMTSAPLVKISGGLVVSIADNLLPVITADNARVVFVSSGPSELYSVTLTDGASLLDIDGDGKVTPTIDGLLLMRWQFGTRGAALIGGISFPAGALRTTVNAIELHMRRLSETTRGSVGW